MNPCSQHLYLDFAKDRMNQRRAEADRYRMIMAQQSDGYRLVDRLVKASRQGLESMKQSLRVDRRPSLPAI